MLVFRSPWVSRARYEALALQLEKCEAERKELLAKVLAHPPIVVAEEKPEPKREDHPAAESKPFTTPFDSLSQRFRNRTKEKAAPLHRFRVRV
jgi:hypothetical protein